MSTLKIRLTTIYITQFYILKLSFIFIFYKMINKIYLRYKKKKKLGTYPYLFIHLIFRKIQKGAT